MAKNRKKILIFNTLLLILCCVIVGLYCLNPVKQELKKYKLSFDSDGGTEVAALMIDECKPAQRPIDPVKDGYIFVGWMLGSQMYNFNDEVCGDTELKAVWEERQPDIKYITVYYVVDGGTEGYPVVVEDGTVPEKPVDPTRDGYTFKGWTLNNNPYNFDKPLSDGDKVFATWEEVKKEEPKPEEPKPEDPNANKTYKVTFNLDGGTGSCKEQTVKHGATAKGCTPTKNGYTFSGWSPAITTKITKDTTFKALWTKKPEVIKYTVSFNLNGGSGNCPDRTVNAGTSVNPASYCSASRTHYKVNWGGSRVINSNYTFTASWTKNTFRITCPKVGEYAADCILHVYDGNSEISTGSVKYSYSGRSKTASIGDSIDANYFAGGTGFVVTVSGDTFNANKG